MLVGFGALLGPYPVMGDIGFASCLAAAHAGAVLRTCLRCAAGHGAAILTRLWPGTHAGMKLKKVFLVAIALASTLLPVMWHLWLVTRAGNANFYYNQASASRGPV